MKKAFIIIMTFIQIFGICFCSADEWYKINEYEWTFSLMKNGELRVSENIEIDFFQPVEEINREIKINKNKEEIKIFDAYIWVNSTETEEIWNNTIIKIDGWKEKLLWKKSYFLSYVVQWLIKESTWYQELYRNIIWEESEVFIRSAKLFFLLPENLELTGSDFYLIKGENSDSTEIISLKKDWRLIFNVTPINLNKNEGLSLIIKFPENYIKMKSLELNRENIWEKSLWSVFKLMWNTISKCLSTVFKFWIPIVILVNFFILLIPNKKVIEKNWEGIRDVIHYNPPKNYLPEELAVINEWSPSMNVFPTLIYKWVEQWNVKLNMLQERKARGDALCYFTKSKEKIKFDYDEKIKKLNISLPFSKTPEEEFRNICFSDFNKIDVEKIATSNQFWLQSMAWDFYAKIHHEFTKGIKWWEKIESLWFGDYTKKTEKRWKNIWRISVILFIVILIFVLFWLEKLASILIIWLWIYLLYIVIKSKQDLINEWNNLTPYWKRIIEETWWFKKYLEEVDSLRLEKMLSENPMYFERILPYAVALWVWKHWISKCFVLLKNKTYLPFWIKNIPDLNRSFLLKKSIESINFLREESWFNITNKRINRNWLWILDEYDSNWVLRKIWEKFNRKGKWWKIIWKC